MNVYNSEMWQWSWRLDLLGANIVRLCWDEYNVVFSSIQDPNQMIEKKVIIVILRSIILTTLKFTVKILYSSIPFKIYPRCTYSIIAEFGDPCYNPSEFIEYKGKELYADKFHSFSKLKIILIYYVTLMTRRIELK